MTLYKGLVISIPSLRELPTMSTTERLVYAGSSVEGDRTSSSVGKVNGFSNHYIR